MMSNESGVWKVFTRTWWRDNPEWPNGLEPCMGPKRKIGTAHSIEDARRMCREYNAANPPGRLSRKAEFERIG